MERGSREQGGGGREGGREGGGGGDVGLAPTHTAGARAAAVGGQGADGSCGAGRAAAPSLGAGRGERARAGSARATGGGSAGRGRTGRVDGRGAGAWVARVAGPRVAPPDRHRSAPPARNPPPPPPSLSNPSPSVLPPSLRPSLFSAGPRARARLRVCARLRAPSMRWTKRAPRRAYRLAAVCARRDECGGARAGHGAASPLPHPLSCSRSIV